MDMDMSMDMGVRTPSGTISSSLSFETTIRISTWDVS